MTDITVKINGPAPVDGQVWRDLEDGDLLLVVSDEDGIGIRAVVIAEGDTLGYRLNNRRGSKSPEQIFHGPREVEYVGMFWEVFALKGVSK